MTTGRPTIRTLVAIFLLSSMLPASTGLATNAPSSFPFAPDPESAQGVALAGRTWTLEAEEYTIHLRRLEVVERQNFIGHATGLKIDPFAAPPKQDDRFISFLLRIENRGGGPIQYNPVNSWLMTNRKKVQYPIGLTDLSFAYHVAGQDFPASYERVGPALMEQTREILPGKSTAGLLVYRVLEPKTKRFHVDVEVTMPNGDLVRFAAPYRRVAEKTRKKR